MYVKITQAGKVTSIYDLQKVSLVHLCDDENTFVMVVDGVMHNMVFKDREIRDKNFEWIVKHLEELDDKKEK